MNDLIRHAKIEFLKLGYKPIEECEDDPDKWIQKNVLELLEVFSNQGHSGFSAPYAIDYFQKLASFKPLTPIMCTDDEWSNTSLLDPLDNLYQNKREGSIFKEGINGKPYYIDAIVWRNQNGNCYTGSAFNSKKESIKSRQYIKIPFTPKTFYIDVIDYEFAEDDWESFIKDESQLKEVWKSFIKDESQLKEVWKYYEHQETPSYLRLKKLKLIDNLSK